MIDEPSFPEHSSSGHAIEDTALSGFDGKTVADLSTLTAPTWFESYGFSVLYSSMPADRALVARNTEDRIVAAHFYREAKAFGPFRELVFSGPFRLPVNNLMDLMRQRHAALAVFSPVPQEEANAIQHACPSAIIESLNEDFVVDLPDDVNTYHASLSKQTRKRIRKYGEDLQQRIGDRIRFTVLSKEQIPLEAVRHIVDLNRSRIEAKGRQSLWTDAMIRQRWALARQCGMLCAYEIDGRVVAGVLIFEFNGECYLALTGHDPDLDHFQLGFLCHWEILKHLIGSGIRRCHFLWGKSQLKSQFGAFPHPLFTVTIFENATLRNLFVLQTLLRQKIASIRSRIRQMLCSFGSTSRQ